MTVNELLQHPLIQKYFGDIQDWKPGEPVDGVMTHGCSAQKILMAMCEPIRKGDKFLSRRLNGSNEWAVRDDWECDVWHPENLRLPDQFQPRREKLTDGLTCNHCGKTTDWHDLKVYGYSIPEILEMERYWRCGNLKRPLEKPPCSCKDVCIGHEHRKAVGFDFDSHGERHHLNSQELKELAKLLARESK